MKFHEENLQETVVQYLTILEMQGKLAFHAVPNGGKRNRITAAILKGQGVKAGVADIEIQWSHAKVGYLEMKAPGKIKNLSAAQKAWRDKMRKLGHLYEVADSLDMVIKILIEWGALEPTRNPHP